MPFEAALGGRPGGGSTRAGQRGSGHLAVPGWCLDTAPGEADPRSRDEPDRQTDGGRGGCEPALEPRRGREGLRRTSQGQNRTRENRPSGIVGGLAETCAMGVGLRSMRKLMEKPPNPTA